MIKLKHQMIKKGGSIVDRPVYMGQEQGASSGSLPSLPPMPARQKPKIGREQVQKATQTLLKYKRGKSNLDARIVENEKWYKVRHWDLMRGENDAVKPASAWLFNCLANKHADYMDNFPSPNVLPREEGDKGEAQMLSSIIPVILDQTEFEQVFSDVCEYKLRSGTGVYGVFWDGQANLMVEPFPKVNTFSLLLYRAMPCSSSVNWFMWLLISSG